MEFDKCNSNLRKLIVGVDDRIYINSEHRIPINFDNAATTPPFKAVIDAIEEFSSFYSSVHRGMGYKSEFCSEFFDNSRKTVASFVNANPDNDVVIYVKNTTEAINKLSYKLCSSKKSIALVSDMEHHSNDLPWRCRYNVDYIPLDETGKLSLHILETKLKKYAHHVKLVSVTGASNVTGIRNSIYDIAELAHKYGAKIFVDCAQLIPHSKFDMNPESEKNHIDYIAFSAHKMYAPFGTGVLVGDKKSLNIKPPEYKGGGTVKIVTHTYVGWEDTPEKDEAGTPNIMGIVALTKAIEILNSLGMSNIEQYENALTSYAYKKLNEIPDIELYAENIDCKDKIGIIPFNVRNIPHSTVARILSAENGISVRNGCFCAQPYIQKLLNLSREDLRYFIKNPDAERPGMVRVSFGLYNNFHEIDKLIIALETIIKNRDFFVQKYKNTTRK